MASATASSRPGLPPLACAAANLVAVVAMATVLAPGTPVSGDVASREAYVCAHLLAWRLGWMSWMLAAGMLLWAYAWWRSRVDAPRSAILIASAGIAADLSSEVMLVVAGADAYAIVAPIAFFLTGAVANALYTIAGIQLTVATPLSARARTYAAFMWSGGLMITLGTLVSMPLVTAIATAELFVLFCPWCLWLAWRLR